MSHPKNRRDRFLKGYHHGLRRIKYYLGEHNDPEWVENYTRRLRQTGKSCSCVMCGNPRKWYRVKTLQERREDEKYSKEEGSI